MNARQQQIQWNLAVIGRGRLTNFIHDRATQAGGVYAVRFLREALERGEDLEVELLGST